MAVRNNQPVQCGFAALVALGLISAAPVLAAPERSICEDASAPTLEVASTEFSVTATADTQESIELIGPNFELASRERAVGGDDEQKQIERAAEDDADADQGDDAVPADTGPLVYKRQMYRRDI